MTLDKINNLIPLETEDLPLLKDWLTDNGVYRNLYQLYHPMSMDELRTWYQNEKNQGAHLFKYRTESNDMSGIAIVHYIHLKNRCGEISFIIHPRLQGQGHGRDLLDRLVTYSFSILNLNKISFHTTEYNDAMKHIAASYGFSLEGTFRRELYFDGEYHDILRFGMLFDEIPSR